MKKNINEFATGKKKVGYTDIGVQYPNEKSRSARVGTKTALSTKSKKILVSFHIIKDSVFEGNYINLQKNENEGTK